MFMLTNSILDFMWGQGHLPKPIFPLVFNTDSFGCVHRCCANVVKHKPSPCSTCSEKILNIESLTGNCGPTLSANSQ